MTFRYTNYIVHICNAFEIIMENNIKTLKVRRGHAKAQLTRFVEFLDQITTKTDAKVKEIPF